MVEMGGDALIIHWVQDCEGTEGQTEDSAFNSVATVSDVLEQNKDSDKEGILLNAWHALSHLTLMTILWNMYCYYLSFYKLEN